MFTQSDVQTAVELINYGMISIDDIPEGEFRVAVENALATA